MKLFVLALTTCFSIAMCEDSTLTEIFKGHNNIVGTVVIQSLDGKTKYIYNDTRSNQRFLPASTFKIPNTLIALEEGVVTESDTIKWDGIKRDIQDWNQDQTLASAFKYSCVPVHQQFASKIGLTRYKHYLKEMNYGSIAIDTNLTSFWLEGKLGISAIEEVSFLRNVIEKKFSFKNESYSILKKIMINDTGSGYVIYAKTGWATRIPEPVGWYVGYVENAGQTWIFATNLLITKPEELALRKIITIEALKAKKII